VVTALLVLFAVTLAIAAAILFYKWTGNRARVSNSRHPHLEIFIGMFLFRVLSIGPVGWIPGLCLRRDAKSRLPFSSPEETVFTSLWSGSGLNMGAIAFSVAVAWLAIFYYFPSRPSYCFDGNLRPGGRLFPPPRNDWPPVNLRGTRNCFARWVKAGPIRLLKLLKLSLIESRDLRKQEVELRRMILRPGQDRKD